jgi:uncharacterized protein (DUF1015 family)
MVEIKAFKGWLYNKDKVDDFSKVITPPNDVISKKEREEFSGMDEHNFVNLILPIGNGDQYENSLNTFTSWKKDEILVQDKEDTIYVYKEAYSMSGKEFSRLSFIGLMKIEPFGEGMLPHEKVLETDIKDRVSLIKTTKANFGIPFVLYDDREKVTDEIIKKAIEGKKAYIDFTDDKGVSHTLWKVDDKEVINKMVEEMKKYQCIIADGHHRYTSNYKVSQMLDIEGAKYALLCFVNSFNEGMVILPTNRVVFDLDIDFSEVIQKISEYFEVQEMDLYQMINKMDNVEVLIDKKINLKNHVFGIYCAENKKSYFLTLKDNEILKERLSDKTDIYRKLDINILHKLIIEEILGISEDQQKRREHIDFIKGNEDTIERIKENNIQCAFFVKPPLMREVFLIARAGETTPQKTTCFYPKVHSGLVVHDFEND